MSATEICRHRHPAEWDAPTPRTRPCRPCIELAVDCGLFPGGPIVMLGLPGPGPVPVPGPVVAAAPLEEPFVPTISVCPHCSGAGIQTNDSRSTR